MPRKRRTHEGEGAGCFGGNSGAERKGERQTEGEWKETNTTTNLAGSKRTWDDLSAIAENDFRAASKSRASASARFGTRWSIFCSDHAIDETLSGLPDADRENIICNFAAHLRHGGTAAETARKTTVEDHLAALAIAFRLQYLPDPRCILNANETAYRRLQVILKGYANADPEPTSYAPISGLIVHTLKEGTAVANSTAHARRQADLAELAYTAILRPGEMTGTSASSPHVLKLRNLTFLGSKCQVIFEDGEWTSPEDAPTEGAAAAPTTAASLLAESATLAIRFETQKNGVKNQTITFDKNQADVGFRLCPVAAASRIVGDLVASRAPPATPISQVADSGIKHITSPEIANLLRTTVAILGQPVTGLLPAQVHTHGLRGGAATSLLNAGITEAVIKDKGRWRSGAYLTYLAAQLPGKSQLATAVSNEAATFTVLPQASTHKRRRR